MLGTLVGLGMAGLPVALMIAYIESFALTATPDSAFNVFTLSALVFTVIATGLLVLSLVLLAFRPTRPLGVGYLVGVGFVVVVSAVAMAVFSV